MKTTVELKVSGRALEMGSEVVSLDLINPLFNQIGDYSLPFTIPTTEINLQILGMDHDDTSFATSLSYPNTVLIIGFIELPGNLIIEGSVTGNINATFYSGRSGFMSQVKGLLLTDLVYSELIYNDDINTVGWLDKISDSASHFYPDYNYVFAPVWMPNIDGDDLSGEIYVVNKFFDFTNKFYVADDPPRLSYFAPYFYLCFVLKQIFKSYGYTIDGNVIEDNDELKNLVVFHTLIENERMTHADFSLHLPKILITDFIAALESKLNVRFVFSTHTNTVSIKFVDTSLLATDSMDITVLSSPEFEVKREMFDGFEITVDADKSSDATSEKLNNINFNNDIFTYIVDNVTDLPALGAEGDLALVKNVNQIYQWDYDDEILFLDWRLVSDTFIDMKVAGTKTITVPQLDRNLIMEAVSSTIATYLPVSNNERSYSRAFNRLGQSYDKLTLLFYRGKVPFACYEHYADLPGGASVDDIYYVLDDDWTYIWGEHQTPGVFEWCPIDAVANEYFGRMLLGNVGTVNINSYPLLTNSMFFKVTDDLYAPFPDAAHCLSLFGVNGLYNKYFKAMLYWQMKLTSKIYRNIAMDDLFLSNFEWDVKVRIRNQNYFINRIPMQIDFARQSVYFDKCELLTV